MRFRITTCVLAAGALLAAGIAQPAGANGRPNENAIFADGGELAGSTNGISFDPDGRLWVANVFGATITQIDPETGDVLDRLTPEDLVFFPDDVIVAPDGTMYWTEIAFGAIVKRPPGGPSTFIVPPGGLNSANPLTLSDDGRLFAAGCYGAPPGNNSLVEIDPVAGGIINTLAADVPLCASNSMDWWDGFLYSPQPYGASVLRIDQDTGASTPVTTNWPVPIGVAINSTGEVYALAQGVGEVVRIDVDDPDTDNNREVVAEIPYGWADNITFDANDRLYISSASDSVIAEVLDDGTLREVVPGKFQVPLGVAVIGNTVYTANPGQIIGWNRFTGDQQRIRRAPFGLGVLPASTNVVAWNNRLVLTSVISGEIWVLHPKTMLPIYRGTLAGPGDVQPYRGDLIVVETGTGNILRLDGDDLSQATVIANVPGATGLARRNGDILVADAAAGAVLKVIAKGKVLGAPEVVVDGLAAPEGIDVRGRHLYVVEGGTQTLTRVDLIKGTRTTIASELGLMAPVFPDVFPIGLFNNVVATSNGIFVNADRANVIYRF